MSSPQQFSWSISIGAAICLAVGCGTAELPASSQVVSTDSEQNLSQPTPTLQTENEQSTPIITPTTSGAFASEDLQAENEAVVTSYEPPFPNRVDLFKAPKRKGRGANITPEGIEESVELLGFVDVDSLQVVLSINGVITSLEEGREISEIEVISIQPPAVVLQRGRQRWQASLEN